MTAMSRRLLARIAAALAAVLILTLVFVRIRYGGGDPYPDPIPGQPRFEASRLESVVALDFPPGNVAVTPGGRIFFCYHPFAQARRFVPASVFELVGGQPRAYPDADFQSRYQGVFGMTVDRENRLWMIEPASLDHARTRLLAFDLQSGGLAFEYWFPPKEAQFAQDLRVSPDGRTVYLADTGLFRFTSASLLVFDIASKTFRKVLVDEPSTRPQDWVIRTKFGPHKLAFGLITFSVGLDGIALSANGETLYFGAMSHDRLYRVPTAALLDPKLSAPDLARQVAEVGRKPLSDGIALDADGNILITDFEHGGIARMSPQGSLQSLVRSEKVIWADGVVVEPNGAILFTDSAIPAYLDPLARPPSLDKLTAARPYHLYRFLP